MTLVLAGANISNILGKIEKICWIQNKQTSDKDQFTEKVRWKCEIIKLLSSYWGGKFWAESVIHCKLIGFSLENPLLETGWDLPNKITIMKFSMRLVYSDLHWRQVQKFKIY